MDAMASVFQKILRQTVFRSKPNLYSFDYPFDVMQQLLSGHEVKGVLDAGASNGRITERLLKLFPKAQAYLFEANQDFKPILDEWAGKDQRVHPNYIALSDHTGEIEINITESTGATSIFKPNERVKQVCETGTDVREVRRIPTITIDEWAIQHGSPLVDVMKFDIQGAEAAALKGATQTLKKTQLIYTEVFYNPMYEGAALFSEIDLILRESGFMLYSMYRPQTDKSGMLTWADVIYVKPDLVKL